MDITKKKVAIIYDWIDSWGGVERVLLEFQHLFPQADFYTSYYDQHKAPWAKDLKIIPSFIQRLPSFIRKNRIMSLPLFPYAFESFNLSEYDLVISVSSAFSKAVITKPHTKHICYLLTPPRYLWGMTDTYIIAQSFMSFVKRFVSGPLARYLREFDYIIAQRPDVIVSISHTVATRCKKYYQRPSHVIYPPFDIEYWTQMHLQTEQDRPIEDNYYLVVSRLEPYKNVHLPINVFNSNKKKLVIIGRGTQKEKLKAMASSNIIFIENITDQQLANWYRHAAALIMPQEEDFGYVALEAQIMGCPVIAYEKGGSCETVVKAGNNVFFDNQSEGALQEALERFEQTSYNGKHTLQAIEPFLKKFSKEQFWRSFRAHISHIL